MCFIINAAVDRQEYCAILSIAVCVMARDLQSSCQIALIYKYQRNIIMTSTNKNDELLIGVDVGSGSVRAGIFSATGKLLGTAKQEIAMHREGGVVAEQSSDDIWQAVSHSVREAMNLSGADPANIAGIGFDATCSLVVLGEHGKPLPVGDLERPDYNIIVWMDHRAVEQAEYINERGHRVLDYVGGRISPEMETPKLLWLKEHRADIYNKAWQFMDLTDFLTWKCTGSLSRSVCTVTCKWTYMAHESSWDSDYFRSIGLADLADDGFSRIGTEIVPAGSPLSQGLTKQAAEDLGLMANTPVGAGLIDAHAGGIGTVGSKGGGGAVINMAYVFGTSSCTMTSTEKPVFVPGVWGPYYSAMVPGLWLNEGGQSAAGAAIAALLELHPRYEKFKTQAESEGNSLPDWLAMQAEKCLSNNQDAVELAKGIHVVPEFIGNRAPFADPHTRAVVTGLGMENDLDSLVALYVAGLCGIGYGLRQIIAAQTKEGVGISRVVISGGAGRDDFVKQLLADACGTEIASSTADEPVLLGSAILGSVAAGIYDDIPGAMEAMSHFDKHHKPLSGEVKASHQKRFEIFENLQAIAREAINS